MTPDQWQNLAKYALAALVGSLVTTGLLLGQMLSGTDVITWRPLAAVFVSSFFGALSTALGSSFLPRGGSEDLARQVNLLKAQGVQRKDMVVVTTDEAIEGIAEAPPPDAGRMPSPAKE